MQETMAEVRNLMTLMVEVFQTSLGQELKEGSLDFVRVQDQ